MKQTFKVLMITFFLALTLSTLANAHTEKAPPDTSSPELQRIKSLAGRWSTVSAIFGKPQRLYTEYQVTAGGSAVLERIFPGTPYEMVSVYYDDNNGKLAMTHYCMMKNRPTLKLTNSTKDTINMYVAKIDGAKSKKEPSMGKISLTFKDKNHFSSTCGGNAKDKEHAKPMTMEFARVR